MGRKKKSEDEEYIEVPDCYGNYGATDDCPGCPLAEECEIRMRVMGEEGEHD
jgi:hypothetical protein